MKKFALLALAAAAMGIVSCGPSAQSSSAAPAADPKPVATAPAPASAPASGPATRVAIDPAKEADIRKLMAVSGAAASATNLKNQLLAAFKQRMPQVPEKFWQDMAREINPQELLDQYVPFYDQAYTHAEIKALVEFYNSPLGKKTLAAQPGLTQGIAQAVKKWGQEQTNRIVQKVNATQGQIQ